MLYKVLVVGFLCLYLGITAGVNTEPSSWPQNQQSFAPPLSAYELLKQIPETSKFLLLLDLELQAYLENHTNITVFAPHNNAFFDPALPLDGNATRYHILPQLCLSDCWDNDGGSLYKSTQYMKLWTNRDNKNTKQIESGNMHSAAVINSIQVPSQQSVVHIIDSILTVPLDIETTLETLNFTKAKDMVSQIHRSDVNEMITLFMPTNQAFGTVDPTTLGFDVNDMIYNVHVVPGLHSSSSSSSSSQQWKDTMKNLAGSVITVHDNQISIDNSTANIIIKDIIAENAVIHGIDQILWSTAWVSSTATVKKTNNGLKIISNSLTFYTVIVVIFVMLNM